MSTTIYTITLVFHIIGVVIAVGSATLSDYLHLVSLRKKSLEKGLVKVYPLVTKTINRALILIYVTGIALVIQNPILLQSNFFRLKVLLVLLVTANGIYLQRKVAPELDKCILKGNKHCDRELLTTSAISGSISIITWYSVLVLAMTKTLGYTVGFFITGYIIVLLFTIAVAYTMEKRARKWRG